jgi:hypothetical protein
VALAKYGTECFNWEPELLRKEIEEDFNIEMSDLQSDKLQTAILIYTTDQFESNWHAFHVGCHLLNNEYADHVVFDQPLEAEYIIGALPEINFLRADDGIKFSDEVNAYAGLTFAEYGCAKPPTLFPTAIMPKGLVDAEMAEKNAALDELYQAKKDSLDKYLAKVQKAYTI